MWSWRDIFSRLPRRQDMWCNFVLGLSLCLIVYLYNISLKDAYEKNGNGDVATKSVLIPPNVEFQQPPSCSLLNVYEKAGICSDKTTCSSIGKVVLQNGGNAIDAAIATLLCNGLITMQSMGIGGGTILNYYNRKERKSISIIGRERAPLNFNLNQIESFKNSKLFAKSALSIAVPGELMAYHEAHSRYGLLPWSVLVQPTLKLCYQGYKLTRHQRDALFLNEEMIRANKLLTQMFVDSTTNFFYKEGWHIQFPSEVCGTYKSLAEEGPLTFYNGTLASLIVKDLNEMGSSITLEDLKSYTAEVKDSLVLDLEPYYVYLPYPPGSGHVISFIMKILHYFKNDFSFAKELNSLEVHRIVEALKFGFVTRWLYDADNKYEDFFNTKTMETIIRLIDDLKTFNDSNYYGYPDNNIVITDYGTAQISVLSPNGDAVSATSSINYYFGSGRMGLRTGILFNNAMSDFTVKNFKNYFNLPNIKNINQLKAQKQPMSSMSPLIATNKVTGDVRLVVGAAGGSRIISTLVQILVRVLWQKNNIKQAIDAPRFHHQLLPNILEYEFGMLQKDIDNLEKRGHITNRERRKSTAVCGVENVEGIIFANADYRKEGGVDGF